MLISNQDEQEEFDANLSKFVLDTIKTEKQESLAEIDKTCMLDGVNEFFRINFYECEEKRKKNALIYQLIDDAISENRVNPYCDFFKLLILIIYDYDCRYLEELFFKKSFRKIDVEDNNLVFISDNKRIRLNSQYIRSDKNKQLFISSLNSMIRMNNYGLLKKLLYAFICAVVRKSKVYISKYSKFMMMSIKADAM